MNELQIIEGALEQAARRQRWQGAWRGFWRGFLAGAITWLVALAVYKLLPVPLSVLGGAGAVAASLAALGFLVGAWRGSSLIEMARWVDQKEQYQERLSTALEVAALPTAGDWRGLVVADAARHASKFNPRRALPFGLPKASRWSLLILAAGVGLGLVPEYRSQAYRQRQRDAEVIRDTGRQLAELTRRTLVQHPPVLPAVRQNLESVTNLGEQLSQAKLTRSEALRDLANAAEKLKQETRQLAQTPALKRLEQAARSPSAKTGGARPDLQKQVDNLQKALDKQAEKLQALNQMKKDLEKAREAAAGLANKDSAGDSAAKDELSKSLAALAQKSHDLGLALPGLKEAIEALAADQTDLLLRDLQNATTDLEKLKDLAQKMEQLQQQAERLGKDLAEQLQKGQAQAAQGTLEKMVNLLKSADLKPEQLKKILDEVAKAVGPAGDYGKVADLLKQAVNQMQQDQRPAAAQSLADAAKELEKLLGEMGDLEALKATLAALGRAQMCVGNCQGWGQRPGQRVGRGKGGRPGKGFGTWANEDGWLAYPEISDLWENPPDDRGNLDPRSNTNRGDGELADNLDPTRLRGKISPGSSMPSITLKGVSIKGLSTVQFQEAALAAQSDAQNALSQDQIPRAYQGAVKDYFDDLKK